MSECKVVLLSDRAVLRVTGEAARNFLQGLITNHIDQAKPGSAIHTGLLTPQGKILVDFFVLPDERRLPARAGQGRNWPISSSG